MAIYDKLYERIEIRFEDIEDSKMLLSP